MANSEKRKKKKKAAKSGLPDRETILRYMAENPEKSNKRDIARAFGISGDARIALKRILAQLREEGVLERKGKKFIKPGSLPPVAVIDIVTRDRNGELVAQPVKWDEKSQGRPPAILIRIQKDAKAVIAGIGDRVLARIRENEGEGPRFSAKIMKKLESQRDVVIGVLREHGDNFRLEPAHRKQKEIDIASHAANGGKDGDLVEVSVGASGRYGLKRGKVVEVIGAYGTEKAASMIAIHENDIPHIFPQSVLDEANEAKSATMGKREDWRDLPLITIDPADAKDHDDAIFAEPDPKEAGGYIVYVAIADVSWFVRHNSALDREALKRGNSVYFPDRVVPMLPERISNDLCSLKPGVERAALAARMVFSADGRKTSHTFHRIMMKSPAKLSYQQAQAAIDGEPDEETAPFLETVLHPLWEAYACLKRGRDNRQPLEIDVPERKIKLKTDGTVDQILVPDRLDAHKLVEEFMIQANVAAAEALEAKSQALIYRIHDAPSLSKLESLREFLQTLNISLTKAGNLRPSHFNGILGQVSDTANSEMVNNIVLRSQSQAEYSPQNLGHFGLNLRRYAHFTSPIRRYADLIVHRALVSACRLGEGGLSREEEASLDIIAADISITERRAVSAERSTVDRLIATYLADQIGESFHGRINGVTKAGLFVTLSNTGADGFVPISSISNEYFIHDDSSRSLIGERTRQVYQIGQDVEVRLVEAAPVAGALRFEMLSDGVESKELPRTRSTNANKKHKGSPGSKFAKKRKRTTPKHKKPGRASRR